MNIKVISLVITVLAVLSCSEYEHSPSPYDHPETWRLEKWKLGEPAYYGWDVSVKVVDIVDADTYVNSMMVNGWILASIEPASGLPNKYVIMMRKKKQDKGSEDNKSTPDRE